MDVETTPYCAADNIQVALQAYGVELRSPSFGNLDDEGGKKLVLHGSLALTLQQAASMGRDVEAVAEEWRDAVKRILEGHRNQPAFYLLASLDEALLAPAAILSLTGETRWNAQRAPVDPEQTVQAEAFFQLIADRMVANDPELSALHQELQRCSYPLGAGKASGDEIDLAEMVQLWRGVKNERDNSDSAQELAARVGSSELVNADTPAHQSMEALKQEAAEARQQLALAHEAKAHLEQAKDNLLSQNRQLIERLNEFRASVSERDARQRETATTLQDRVSELQRSQSESAHEVSRLQSQYRSVEADNAALRRQIDALTQPPEPAPPAFEPIQLNADERKPLRKSVRVIKNSRFFDRDWYLKRNPDISKNRKYRRNPALHYLLFGGFEGRHPGPEFDSIAYYRDNPDVYRQRLNPLLHYLRYGQQENRPVRQPTD